jgi:hypothetical protein
MFFDTPQLAAGVGSFGGWFTAYQAIQASHSHKNPSTANP